MPNEFDFQGGFVIDFDFATGLSHTGEPTRRYLNQMKGMYADEAAFSMADGDALVYEFYELGAPEHPGDVAFGTSITYPGKVGNEFFMTKGHFHSIPDTAESYLCLSGKGYIIMESPEGEWKAELLTPGKALYVPKRYAHRSVNVGDAPFITFFAFRADAGHDYGTIETQGFRHLIVERAGLPAVIENPKWKR